MRRLILSIALAVSLGCYAQLLNVGGVQQVAIPEDAANKVAAISPDGSYLLITTDYNAGLTRYDLTTGKTTKITDAPGAGYDVKISDDGSKVVYRETSFNKNHLKMTAVKSVNITSGKKTELLKATRSLQAMDVQGGVATTVNEGRSNVKALNKTAVASRRVILSIDRLHLMKTVDGVTAEFAPLGTDKRYIWPSVSPDGSKALFYVTGEGAYVCNIDGTGIRAIGQVRAPRWYSDEIIVGMNDADDGMVYTSSSIVAVDLNGVSQTLTSDDVIAMYPLPTADGRKIAFSTPTGEAYIISINK